MGNEKNNPDKVEVVKKAAQPAKKRKVSVPKPSGTLNFPRVANPKSRKRDDKSWDKELAKDRLRIQDNRKDPYANR
jgi:hypothetical protein